MIYAALASLALAAPVATSDWKVKKLEFSAVSIGIAMANATTGWSSFTNEAEPIAITRTTDGGATFNPVIQTGKVPSVMVMGVDHSIGLGGGNEDIVTTGMLATKYSHDGLTFQGSLFGPFVSQSIQAYDGGRVVIATDDGICISHNAGATYKCTKVKELTTMGRYASSPSEGVIYLSAGMWPAQPPTGMDTKEHQLTANLRITNRTFDGTTGKHAPRLSMEMGPRAPSSVEAPPSAGYHAQLLKSTDGGETWVTLMRDEGTFYFNNIDCIDETHCVVVAEGFGKDGSKSPGARVYATTDGKNFTLTHHDTLDGVR